jgi:hypothetical protein
MQSFMFIIQGFKSKQKIYFPCFEPLPKLNFDVFFFQQNLNFDVKNHAFIKKILVTKDYIISIFLNRPN